MGGAHSWIILDYRGDKEVKNCIQNTSLIFYSNSYGKLGGIYTVSHSQFGRRLYSKSYGKLGGIYTDTLIASLGAICTVSLMEILEASIQALS
jgi:hypothetical protein